jgi:hypothetical protein
MHPLSYGYKQFDTGDRAKGAAGWMAAWEFNTARLNGHNHDGANSAKLSITSLDTLSSTIVAANWVVFGAGYRYLLTVPAAILDIDQYVVQFMNAISRERLYLGFDRFSATQIYVYCNDNTIDVTAIYR